VIKYWQLQSARLFFGRGKSNKRNSWAKENETFTIVELGSDPSQPLFNFLILSFLLFLNNFFWKCQRVGNKLVYMSIYFDFFLFLKGQTI
jgi:hypothetical protein